MLDLDTIGETNPNAADKILYLERKLFDIGQEIERRQRHPEINSPSLFAHLEKERCRTMLAVAEIWEAHS